LIVRLVSNCRTTSHVLISVIYPVYKWFFCHPLNLFQKSSWLLTTLFPWPITVLRLEVELPPPTPAPLAERSDPPRWVYAASPIPLFPPGKWDYGFSLRHTCSTFLTPYTSLFLCHTSLPY
jgi:hypothetical protein